MKRLLPILAAGAVILAACGEAAPTATTEAMATTSASGLQSTTTSPPASTTSTTISETTTTTLRPDVAATVAGESIGADEVESLIDNAGEPIDSALFAQFLGFAIRRSVTLDAASSEWDITATEEEITAEADQIYADLSNEDETREDFLSLRGVTEAFLRGFAEQQIVEEAVRAEIRAELPQPTQEQIEQQRNEEVASNTEVCTSHILVDTEEEARDVLDRLAAGEEFSQLATELSEDVASADNGGDLGCTDAGQFVIPFRDATLTAPIGKVLDESFETEFGYHVVLVSDRTEPDPADLPGDDAIVEALLSDTVEARFDEWFLDAVASSEVKVNSVYGAWVGGPEAGVIPP